MNATFSHHSSHIGLHIKIGIGRKVTRWLQIGKFEREKSTIRVHGCWIYILQFSSMCKSTHLKVELNK